MTHTMPTGLVPLFASLHSHLYWLYSIFYILYSKLSIDKPRRAVTQCTQTHPLPRPVKQRPKSLLQKPQQEPYNIQRTYSLQRPYSMSLQRPQSQIKQRRHSLPLTRSFSSFVQKMHRTPRPNSVRKRDRAMGAIRSTFHRKPSCLQAS